MDRAGALAGGAQAGVHRDVQLGRRAALAHLEDMSSAVPANGAHLHHLRQHRLGRDERRHRQLDRPEAADLALGRDGALVPGMGLARAAVVGQAQALAFRVLEVERRAPGGPGDLAGAQARGQEPVAPPVEAAVHPQPGAGHAVSAAPLGPGRPVEEGDVGPGRGEGVGVEQVIGRDVVLVHRLLDEAHPQNLGVEPPVAGGVGGDRGQVVQAGELHGVLPLRGQPRILRSTVAGRPGIASRVGLGSFRATTRPFETTSRRRARSRSASTGSPASSATKLAAQPGRRP